MTRYFTASYGLPDGKGSVERTFVLGEPSPDGLVPFQVNLDLGWRTFALPPDVVSLSCIAGSEQGTVVLLDGSVQTVQGRA